MKLKKFRRLFQGLPPDTKIMVVVDWSQNGSDYGHPLLGAANTYTRTYDEPQGLDDDGLSIAYIWHDPQKEKQVVTLKEFRKFFEGFPPDTEIMVVVDWKKLDQQGDPLLASANDTFLIEHELEWDGDNDHILYIFNCPEKE